MPKSQHVGVSATLLPELRAALVEPPPQQGMVDALNLANFDTAHRLEQLRAHPGPLRSTDVDVLVLPAPQLFVRRGGIEPVPGERRKDGALHVARDRQTTVAQGRSTSVERLKWLRAGSTSSCAHIILRPQEVRVGWPGRECDGRSSARLGAWCRPTKHRFRTIEPSDGRGAPSTGAAGRWADCE